MLSAAKFIITIQPFVLPVLVGAVCLAVSAVLVIAAVRQIMRQVKLYNSITLVELKNFKWHYYVFICVIAFFIFYAITQMADPEAPEIALMHEKLHMARWQTNMVLGALVGCMVCVEFLLVVLARSRSAVVDRGVYSGMRYFDWYHVHDYIIDEEHGQVILSSDKYTFFTLLGTTPPLKVAKNDIPKLKFILNKNKNKFSL
ncbi:MAG: hypothetical protein HFE46_03480 [Clostridia bacterium]|nr:hypothetical protein [Clostridia bacterium]